MAEDPQTTEETPQDPKSMSLLAKEYFGSNFHGEVPPETEPEDQETEKEQPTEEASETEPGSEPEVETEPGPTEEVHEFELSEVAQMLGVDEDRVDVNEQGQVVLVSKVDGETKPVAARDLLDNAQMFTAADKRLEEAKEKAKAQNTELQQKSESLQQHLVQAGKLVEKAEELLDRDSKAVDWKQLREDDPAEYSAKKAEFAERRQEIDQMKQEAIQAYQHWTQESQLSSEDAQQLRQKERENMLNKIPEWQTKPEVAKEEGPKIPAYLNETLGFNKEEIEAMVGNNDSFVGDHRFIVMARKAMLFDQGQQKKTAASKKITKVPKVLKPGASKSQTQVNNQKVQKAKQRLKQSHSLDDAAALLKAQRGG